MSLKELLQILVRILESEGGESKFDEKSEKGKALKKANDITWAKRVVERYKSDSNFRFLRDQISKLFADLLNSDIRFWIPGRSRKSVRLPGSVLHLIRLSINRHWYVRELLGNCSHGNPILNIETLKNKLMKLIKLLGFEIACANKSSYHSAYHSAEPYFLQMQIQIRSQNRKIRSRFLAKREKKYSKCTRDITGDCLVMMTMKDLGFISI